MSVELKVDWCSHEAAKYAVEHWHYSRTMPVGKLVRVGVWENGRFIGCVIYGRGGNQFLGKQYGLEQVEVCELVRIALHNHKTPVSQIAARSIKMLKIDNPGMRLIVSFADQRQGHNGGIYQAMNWVYVGRGQDTFEFFHNGKWKHNREITSGAFGKARKIVNYSSLPKRESPGKHKYLYPLDRAMRKQIASLAKPYPKRDSCVQSIEGDTVGIQPTGEGSIPSDRSLIKQLDQ